MDRLSLYEHDAPKEHAKGQWSPYENNGGYVVLVAFLKLFGIGIMQALAHLPTLRGGETRSDKFLSFFSKVLCWRSQEETLLSLQVTLVSLLATPSTLATEAS